MPGDVGSERFNRVGSFLLWTHGGNTTGDVGIIHPVRNIVAQADRAEIEIERDADEDVLGGETLGIAQADDAMGAKELDFDLVRKRDMGAM